MTLKKSRQYKIEDSSKYRDETKNEDDLKNAENLLILKNEDVS